MLPVWLGYIKNKTTHRASGHHGNIVQYDAHRCEVFCDPRLTLRIKLMHPPHFFVFLAFHVFGFVALKYLCFLKRVISFPPLIQDTLS